MLSQDVCTLCRTVSWANCIYNVADLGSYRVTAERRRVSSQLNESEIELKLDTPCLVLTCCLLLAATPPLSAQPEDWTRPFPAHRVIGNLYAVGTYNLGVFLITSDEGHILINTGLEDSTSTQGWKTPRRRFGRTSNPSGSAWRTSRFC